MDKKVRFCVPSTKILSTILRRKTPYHRPKSEKNIPMYSRAITYRRRKK